MRLVDNFVAAVLVMLAVAMSFGQTVSVLADRTAELQAMLDAPGQDIDLRNEVWAVKRLTLHVGHSGKTIRNGVIKYFGPDGKPQYQLIEIIQGRAWNGKTYPAGKVNLRLAAVTLDGSFAFDSGLQEHNEKVAAEQKKDFNLIGPMTNKAGDIFLDDVTFVCCGGSGWGGSCDSLTAKNVKGFQVAKHVLALPGWGGMKVSIDGLLTIECGNAFDLSNPTKDLRDVFRMDVADVRNVASFDNRGRTKLASPNWFARFNNHFFKQTNIVSLNTWPALDNSYNTHHVAIDGFEAVNFFYGFGTQNDELRNDGTIEVRNSRFIDCFIPTKAQQRIILDGAVMQGHYQKSNSGNPIERNVTESGKQSAAYWAARLDEIARLYDQKNTEWGTAYTPPNWGTIPKAVRDLMETQ